MEQFKAYLHTIAPLADTDIAMLEEILIPLEINKKDYILKQGEICKHIYYLRKGLVRMFYLDDEGNEINCRFTFGNLFFVEYNSFLTQTASKYDWQALQDCELFAIKYQDVQRLYAISTAWDHFGRLIAERVYLQTTERVEMLSFLSPTERYTYLLKKSPELFNLVSQAHLASYLGVKPESLSRLRKRLLRK